jgi:hypothetical protein
MDTQIEKLIALIRGYDAWHRNPERTRFPDCNLRLFKEGICSPTHIATNKTRVCLEILAREMQIFPDLNPFDTKWFDQVIKQFGSQLDPELLEICDRYDTWVMPANGCLDPF